jgi:hypothetical protein
VIGKLTNHSYFIRESIIVYILLKFYWDHIYSNFFREYLPSFYLFSLHYVPSKEKATFMETLYMYFYTDLIYFHMQKHEKLPFFHGDFFLTLWSLFGGILGWFIQWFSDFHLWNYWKSAYLSVSIFSKFSFNHTKKKNAKG